MKREYRFASDIEIINEIAAIWSFVGLDNSTTYIPFSDFCISINFYIITTHICLYTLININLKTFWIFLSLGKSGYLYFIVIPMYHIVYPIVPRKNNRCIIGK